MGGSGGRKGGAASRRTWRRSTRAGTAPALTIAFAAFGSRLARDLRAAAPLRRERSEAERRSETRAAGRRGGEASVRRGVRGEGCVVRGVIGRRPTGNGLRRQHRSDRFLVPPRHFLEGARPLRLLVIAAVEQRIHQRADGEGARARRRAELPERLGGDAGRPGIFMEDDCDQYPSILAASEADERGELRRPEHRRLVQPREPRRVGEAPRFGGGVGAAGGGERRGGAHAERHG